MVHVAWSLRGTAYLTVKERELSNAQTLPWRFKDAMTCSHLTWVTADFSTVLSGSASRSGETYVGPDQRNCRGDLRLRYRMARYPFQSQILHR